MTCIRKPLYNAFIKLPLPAFLPGNLPGSSGISDLHGARIWKPSSKTVCLKLLFRVGGGVGGVVFRDASGMLPGFSFTNVPTSA